MATQATFRTRYDTDAAAKSVVFKASVDAASLTSTAVLSYPAPDLAGDVVVPEGMDFSRHALDPRVDIEHRRDPAFGDATVGWARTTCKSPGGYYTVRPVSLDCGGRPRPLPVATTHFDPDDRLESQAFALVERDVLPAVSVEFVPDMACAKSLGRSPLEPRDAYEFGRVRVVRYTLCAKGVCPSALVAKSAYDPLRGVLSAGRVGGEQLHETIKKALAHYLPGKSNTVTSGYTVEKSDMDSYAPPADPPAPEPEPEDPPAGGGATPTAQTAYDAAQMLKDCAQHIRESVGQSEHKAGKKKMLALADKLDGDAEKTMAVGDQVAADVEAGGDMDADDDEPEVEEGATEPDDDDGVMKGMKAGKRVAYLKALRRVFTLAEINKAEEAKAPAATPGDGPEDVAALEKEIRLYRRDKRIYG